MADAEALRLLLLAQMQSQATTPRSPVTSSAAAQVQLDNNFINSSEFRIFCFKILPCTRRYGHDWTACPFCHPGEKATRRCPQKHQYMPLACPDVKKTGECPRRDACTYAHNVFEFWCHPLRFRTQLCSYGADCKRSICFFAHSYSELRVVDQSLLQELERQMDLLGEGAGFGFPPASKRSGREERYGSLTPGDVFSPTAASRRCGGEDGMSQRTPMSEARAVAERAMPSGLLPDGTPQNGQHRSDASSPFTSMEGLTVDVLAGESSLGSGGGSGGSGGSGGGGSGGGNATVTTPGADASNGLEPSMAALQALQMQVAMQQRQQRPSYGPEKLQAASAILGLDVSYLTQVLQAAPPPPPQPATNGVQAAMQALMQQLLAANASNGNTAAQAASPGGAGGGNMPSLGGWGGQRGADTGHSNAMAMLMGMAEGGNGGGVGSLRIPSESINAVPSLRANEEQMASTLKVLMELNNTGSRNTPNSTALATPRRDNGGQVHSAMQQLQELGSLRPQLVQQLQELGSLAANNSSNSHAGNGSVQTVMQQLQEQLGGLRMQQSEPEPAAQTGLAAALASMQQSIDAARLQQALGNLTGAASLNLGGGNNTPRNTHIPDNNTSNASAALVSALLSQLSGNAGNAGAAQPQQQYQNQQQYPNQQQYQQQHQSPGGPSLSDMGLSAFSGASAAAIAAAAAAQAAGTHLTVAPQPQDRAYGSTNGPLAISYSHNHNHGASQFHGGNHNHHNNNPAAAPAAGGQAGTQGHVKGCNSPSPVDVLSMRSQRSGPVGSGSGSLTGSDGSGSPPPPKPAAEVSESVEEEDLAAHPELQGAHRLLGTLSELVGGGSNAGPNSNSNNGGSGSPIGVPSNSAAAAAAASSHPLRGSPSLRPGAVSFSPPGSTLLGATMSSPLLGLDNLQHHGSFTSGPSNLRPSFESRLFGVGPVGPSSGGLGVSSGPFSGAGGLLGSASISLVGGSTGGLGGGSGLGVGVVGDAESSGKREEGEAGAVAEKRSSTGGNSNAGEVSKVEEALMAAVSDAVALLTPAGTGSFNAHNFPAEL